MRLHYIFYTIGQMQEKELIHQCIAGKATAQKMLYERFSSKMIGVCMRYFRTVEEAEDVLQDGFIKIFQNLSSYRGDGSLDGWIRRTIVNTALDQLRKKKEERVGNDVEEFANVFSVNETVSAQLGHEVLLKLIASMPNGYRTVFNLFAIEGYSHKEIGDLLHITENTSKSQYKKARHYLENSLIELKYIESEPKLS